MAKSTKMKAEIEVHPVYGTPQRYYDVDENPSTDPPQKIAEAVLKKIADELGIADDLSQLKFDQVRESVLGRHVLFQQHYAGKPVSRAWVAVDIDPNGRIFQIRNDLIPAAQIAQADERKKAKAQDKALSENEAKAKALEATESTGEPTAKVVEIEQVFLPIDGVPTAAWKTVVVRSNPAREWKVYIDLYSGEVLDKILLIKHRDGRGRVFDPNPVVTLNDTTLEDNSPIPDAAYFEVTLRDLDNSGFLDGKYVSTRNTKNRVQRTDFQFLFQRPDKPFKEVMVYFHIDRAQRYFQELGFTNIVNQAIPVNIDGTRDDNSWYSPVTKSLTFGIGGVDDAEDAEIILHEYGHACQDSIIPGFGGSAEAGAMGEGFGDYLAASFFADRKPERMRPTVGNWDAVAYSGDDPPSLRRLDSTKKYPRDMHNEVHDDGEIWSACLWEIRNAIGGQIADKLIIAHHWGLSPNASFEQAANQLIVSDQQLNAGRNEQTIRDVFVRRGILPNPKRGNKRAGVPFSKIHLYNVSPTEDT
jgi:Zn-dependent metalloprotease